MVVSCTASCHPHTKNGWKQMSYCCSVFAVFGLALCILGAILPKILNDQMYRSFDSLTIISNPEAEGYAKWQNNQDDPILLSTYIIEVLNPDDVVKGAQPQLAERGPYIYREYRVNDNVTWADDGNIISYIQYKYYIFQPGLDGGAMSDTDVQYTTLNMPFFGLYYSVRDIDDVSTRAVIPTIYQYTLPGQPFLIPFNDQNILFTKRTPREIVFGWEDPALILIRGGCINQYPNNTDICPSSRYPGSVANETYQPYTQYTGLKDMSKIRSYINYNNETEIMACAESLCQYKQPAWKNGSGIVHGSDGSQWHHDITPSDTLTFFYGPAYRATDLVHDGETRYRDVPLYVYHLPDSLWLNATNYPPNADYYHFGPNGQLNLTVMTLNTPTFMSYPRMEGVDEWVRQGVHYNSTITNASTPETVFYVEPISGAAFYGETSSQANVYIQPVDNIPNLLNLSETVTWLQDVKPVYFPLFWASEAAGISQQDADKFNQGIDLINMVTKLSYYGGIPIGILSLFIGLYSTWRSRQHFYRTPQHGQPVDTLLSNDAVESDKLDTVKIENIPTIDTLPDESPRVVSPYGTFKNKSPNIGVTVTDPSSPTGSDDLDDNQPDTPSPHHQVITYQSPESS